MNWKQCLGGVVVGVAASYLAKKTITKNNNLSSNEVLHIAKAAFKKKGPINGSWINMEKETLHTPESSLTVYRGGITRMNGEKQEVFEFVSDCETGTILDVNQLT
ncbi:hypothetical protein ACTQ5K_07825 [Niallia sp. Sow4_A1]|jgi:predicted small secreted protein|uniref:PepSY domain-containing protein n=1 Tax=Niallia hominis TaxID=3133173 RepID=A0ABV1F2Y6_9BACI|nr:MULTISPECIES: hypothetical protein [Bacillaceae]MCF2648000.1 hypothetical protein [Niallia circulans]MCM3362838.1 hypothetical protein [Niallia sp. MER TA 168]CAI9393948.1 hypothetical protein BACSP_03715 [Bacillus sp. T2.9-1]